MKPLFRALKGSLHNKARSAFASSSSVFIFSSETTRACSLGLAFHKFSISGFNIQIVQQEFDMRLASKT